MKTSRDIMIVSFLLMILVAVISAILIIIGLDFNNVFNLSSNIFCGLIVTFITSVCEFQSAKTEFICEMYDYYYDLYMSFYFTVKGMKNNHYDVEKIHKKLVNPSFKINSILSKYYGIFKKKDKTYKMLNPGFEEIHAFSFDEINKCINKKNNVEIFTDKIVPFFMDIDNILRRIDEKRFIKDLEVSATVYSFLNKK